MLYDNEKSLLLATGLSLGEIAEVINSKDIEASLEEKGGKYLDRYLTFKKYKQLTFEEKLKLPILPIIAALPCVGKTTTARDIASAFGIGIVMGGDAFRAALRNFVSQEKNPEFFCSVYQAWKFFGEENEQNILKGFDAQAKISNNAVERILVDRGIRDGESMIFEYLHFLPSHFTAGILQHPAVIPIVLRLDSMEEWKRRVGVRDKMTHFRGESKRLLDALDRYKMMQEYQCAEARKFGIPVVSNDNLKEGIDTAIGIIIEKIKKLN